MSDWFQKGRNSELSCSKKCTGDGGGTIIPGACNCASKCCFPERTREDLSFWKRNSGKSSLTHSLPPATRCPASQPNPGTCNSLFPDLVQQPLPTLHCESHHTLPCLAPQPCCWIQIITGISCFVCFPPKRLFTYSLDKLNRYLSANHVSGTGLGLGFSNEQNGPRHYSNGRGHLPALGLFKANLSNKWYY